MEGDKLETTLKELGVIFTPNSKNGDIGNNCYVESLMICI